VNKTIYLPDEEAETWEKARKLANDRLSPVILKALKEFVAEKEAEVKGYERIQVQFEDSDDHYIPKIKAFNGKWIFGPAEPLRIWNSDETVGDAYCVAVTAKGNIVVYMWKLLAWSDGDEPSEGAYRLLVFPSFEEAARDNDVNDAIREAIKKRGIPVEELDI